MSVRSQARARVVPVLAGLVLALAMASLGVLPSANAASAACPEGEVPPSRFADVAGNFHEHTIDCVVWHGIAQGVSASEYAPTRGVRRDQMAAFVARTIRAAGLDLGHPADQGFTDVEGNAHVVSINQLAAHGVVQGTSATTYTPEAVVRRDQMATFLVRAAELVAQQALPAEPTEFTDIAGNVHEENITKAATNGLARGTTATTYSPHNEVRRDQMASFLANTLELLGVAPPAQEPPPEDPDLVYRVQAMYVVPSDGEDRGLATDGSITASVRNFNDWLADQTGGARIRMAMESGDISVVFHRAARTEAEYSEEGVWVRDALEEDIVAAGFDEPATIYLVYYDGVVADHPCGAFGPFPPDLIGTAAVGLIKDCEPHGDLGTPYMDLGMLHEIVHALGIVPANTVDGSPCAPNNTGDGHVDDDPRDLMYAGPEDWDTDNMLLDVGADDYAYTPHRPGCPNLLFSSFLDPLPEPNFPPPGW